MWVHRRLIKEMISIYGIDADLDADHDVLVSAVRADLVDGGRLEAVLSELERQLRAAKIDDQAIHALKNIVLELAGNIALHGTGSRSEPELLVVSRRDFCVQVWLFGYGRPKEIERLFKIIRDIGSIGGSPDRRTALFEQRNQSIMQKTEPGKLSGSGVGMLTVAALSSKPLWFKLGKTREYSSFVLRSTVQAASA